MMYQYCETDPINELMPTSLLAGTSRGLVPAIKHGEWVCSDSAVILEYVSLHLHLLAVSVLTYSPKLEELDTKVQLHPVDLRTKAKCRLWIEFINSEIVPAFYGLLAAMEEAAQNTAREKLRRDIKTLVQAADEEGPYFLGDQMCLVDVHLAPFVLRLSRILQALRGWTPVLDSRWQVWLDVIENNVHVKNTVSGETMYVETVDMLVKIRRAQDGG